MAANDFFVNKQEYLFKLIPDLSIFDTVEKYFLENNYGNNTTLNDMFVYNPTNSGTITDVYNFRRFILKTNIKDIGNYIKTKSGALVKDSNTIIFHPFIINDDIYCIVIDEQFLSNGFRIGKSTLSAGEYIIGVCF